MTQRLKLSEKFQKISSNLYFVIVEPEVPGNVGSIARALKTTGFKNLILVNPCDLSHPEVEWMAHRSMDIVKNSKIVSSFDEAIQNMRLTVATTMRRRHFKFPFYMPEELTETFLAAGLDQPIAIVFGRERTGLTNEELLKCHLHSTIPTATQNPALNLAQSVMIYAHTFFLQINKVATGYTYALASQYEIEKFYEHLQASLKQVNFVPRDGMDNFITRVRRLIGRSQAESRDIRLLHKVLQIFETRITELEKHIKEENKPDIY
jgi:tRNA (cytidine32/uridine32-2'-O)-methyltransferase